MNRGFQRSLAFLTGAGVGAGLMYLLDPDSGTRRRALARDRAVSTLHSAEDLAGKAGRDLRNRARGAAAAARSRFARAPSDEVLVERLRSRMGRFVSHPRAIEIEARDGYVAVRGPILADEAEALLAALQSVRGVNGIENQLEPHDTAEGIPALQGGGSAPGAPPELAQHEWTPAVRVLASATGIALLSYGIGRRRPFGLPALLVGAGLVARGFVNAPLGEVLGVRGGRRVVEVRKHLHIAAPVAEVFDFWQRIENFPRFMSHLVEVRDHGNGRSHWVARGPAGVPVHWDAVITRFEPNQLIAWRSEPGSPVRNAGIVQFREENGGTQVQIRLGYNPPAGALGVAFAKLFGADAKSEMDADLVRLKSLLETGKATAHGETVTRESVAGGSEAGESETGPGAAPSGAGRKKRRG